MPSAGALPGPLQLTGLVAAAALLVAGLWVLWCARHPSEDQRVHLPVLRTVGVPTALTTGLCLLGSGYHVLAYSLHPRVILAAVPIDRWWIVAGVVVLTMAGALAAERLESRAPRRKG